MKSWFSIVDFVGLFVLMIIMATTFNRMNIYEQEYNAQRLSKATEYSTEAAFSETLAQNNADTDYTKLVSVKMDNRKTLDTFDDMMCFNYGLTRTDRSKSAIEDSIRGGFLAFDDGFYLLSLEKDSDSSQKLMWTPKLPYTKVDDKRRTIAFNLQDKSYHEAEEKNGTVICKTGKDAETELNLGSNFGRLKREAISNSLTDAITWSVDNNDAIRGEAEFGTYVPSKQTENGINSVSAPTIMFILQGGGYTGEVAHENVALTGYRAIHKVRTIAYIRNGQKKYTYEWQIPTSETPDIIEYYDTPEKAAADGYTPDYDYIFRPVNYITTNTPKIESTE